MHGHLKGSEDPVLLEKSSDIKVTARCPAEQTPAINCNLWENGTNVLYSCSTPTGENKYYTITTEINELSL